jgi:hypothetical protein
MELYIFFKQQQKNRVNLQQQDLSVDGKGSNLNVDNFLFWIHHEISIFFVPFVLIHSTIIITFMEVVELKRCQRRC